MGMDQVITHEYCALDIRSEFARPGDSGGIVVDGAGAVVGMLFGGPNVPGGAGYIQPIQTILDDIQAQLGYTASLQIVQANL